MNAYLVLFKPRVRVGYDGGETLISTAVGGLGRGLLTAALPACLTAGFGS